MIEFKYNDGGRIESGRKGSTSDCVCRAIAIASGLPYDEIYARLANGNATQRKGKREKGRRLNRPGASGKRTASHGINTNRKWFKDYMTELGFTWTATMGIGTGCRVHLVADELPKGRIVCAVSKHYTAVIDGVVNDTHDPSRNGTRCVYGYWSFEK